ncbi:unnamed protein product [Paramecium sonneborni]|uniref:Uncharacterized protein n=1 Tax=Paramecium sonneborni TaxID=65129 RepID=A0A8S1NGM0_9CILI|nr:unnamed protein product [Paramecium sonneborni]
MLLRRFYIDFSTQQCLSIQGFYSVTINTNKYSIFYKEKCLEIFQISLNLREGIWRPNSLLDYLFFCIRNIENFNEGWTVENKSYQEDILVHNVKNDSLKVNLIQIVLYVMEFQIIQFLSSQIKMVNIFII